MWSIIITVAILTICITIPLSLKKAKEKDDASSNKTNYKPEVILKAIGVEVIQAYHKESYLTVYQGGNFIFNFKKETNYTDIIYPGFEYFPFEHIQKALMAANHINYKYATWTCYIEKSSEENEKEPFKVSLSARIRLSSSLPLLQDQLKETLGSAFRIARTFCDILAKDIQTATENEKIFFNDAVFNNKLNYIRNLHLLGDLYAPQSNATESSVLSVHNLLKLYSDEESGCLQSMLLTCNEQTEKWTDIEAILHFDIREFIRKHPDTLHIHHLILHFSFELQELLVSLSKAKGSTSQTLFFNVHIIRSGNDLTTHTRNRSSIYSQSLLEIRLSDPDKDYWEAKYTIDDAQDKVQSGKTAELNDEQLLILSHTHPSIQLSLYWGKRYYNHQCPIQSLFYFNQVHRSLTAHCKDWKKKDKELYYEICYYIGSIYMELNMLEKAFYYLFIAQSQRLDAAIGLIDCLCYMEDPNAKSYIYSTLEQTIRQMHESEEEAEKLTELYHLLKRRYAHVLVNRKEWNEAKLFLNKMIENGEDVEFAQNELNYISKQQEKEESSPQ